MELGNTLDGVLIEAGASMNEIGGTDGSRNVISGNNVGVRITGSDSSRTEV